MGLPSVSRIGASPLWRAGLAIVFILGLAGFAAGVIPQACRSGAVVCDGSAGLDLEPVTPVDAAPTPQDGSEALVADRPSPAPPSEAPSPQGGEGTIEPKLQSGPLAPPGRGWPRSGRVRGRRIHGMGAK